MKVGGSTASGINFRIAQKVAQRELKNVSMCSTVSGHFTGRKFQHRIQNRSFLWSLLREPTKRVVSDFFHFHVSRQKTEPNDENFQDLLERRQPGYVIHEDYYIKGHKKYLNHDEDPVEVANLIIKDYDFIGVME